MVESKVRDSAEAVSASPMVRIAYDLRVVLAKRTATAQPTRYPTTIPHAPARSVAARVTSTRCLSVRII